MLMERKKKLFLRIGATMTLTESEFDLLCLENDQAADMIKAKLEQGDYEIDGETYFPGAIDQNDGAWFHENDIEFTF